ncbi:MAG: MinD/ParA family protein [Phycisphaerales bacterium]|nr:MinD/ParA family protein [Phycisphaerales bacterium]
MSVLGDHPAARLDNGDQASQLRALMRSAEARPTTRQGAEVARRACVIAVASGKGGVGKTSLSVNLAATLALRGCRTVLVDGDLGLANADVLCGTLAVDHLGHVLDGQMTLDDIQVEVAPGFALVPGGSGIARLADLSATERLRILDAMDDLRLGCDALLMDCGAGIGSAVLSLAASSDLLLVVTTPEPTAIADAYALIKALVLGPCVEERHRPGIGLIVNQVNGASDASFVHRRIASVAERFLSFSPELVGRVSSDRAVREAARHQRPFALYERRAKASRDVARLAAALERRLKIVRSASRPEGGKLWRILRRHDSYKRHIPDLE